MKALPYIMLGFGAAALTTIVAAEALGWPLSDATMLALAGIVGWVMKSPQDLAKKLAAPKPADE